VQPEHLADRFKDAILPQVLATPVMILIMENAALNAIRPFLDALHRANDSPSGVRMSSRVKGAACWPARVPGAVDDRDSAPPYGS
jgi:hypothetical protein